MSGNRLAIVCAVGVALCSLEATRAGNPATVARGDLASEARKVFSARCAHCHGPDVPKPKNGFGYILDLQRLAGNPDLVVPFKPTESELWMLIHNGEMPPPDSPTGALTSVEKETIHAWIVGGAPAGSAPADKAEPANLPEGAETAEPPAMSFAWRALRWLGKLHLLLLHFPIALLLVAGASELWWAWKGCRCSIALVRSCVCLGAIAAVPTVALGWLYALGGHGATSPDLLGLHRWVGTAGGLWLVATALFVERDARRGTRSRHVRIMLFVAVLLVALTAHFGGILAHGKDFFNW
jgi:mono/diheme cytochrome c family protein